MKFIRDASIAHEYSAVVLESKYSDAIVLYHSSIYGSKNSLSNGVAKVFKEEKGQDTQKAAAKNISQTF